MQARPKRTTANTNPQYTDTPEGRRTVDAFTPVQFSPTALARKLDDLRAQLADVNNIDNVLLELKGFDLSQAESLEEYDRLREEIRKQTEDPEMFDENGRTELNMDAAAIAGAKMVIDSERSTRSLSKKLAERAGIPEDEILYKGLPNEGPERGTAQQLNASRKASLVESLVDFQKQIQFKINVLKHINNAKKDAVGTRLSKSDGRVTRGRVEKTAVKKQESALKKGAGRTRKRGAEKEAENEDGLRTPAQTRKQPNPLDDKRIYDDYASEVASELREANRKRRRTAPIPFNLNLLDDVSEKDGVQW